MRGVAMIIQILIAALHVIRPVMVATVAEIATFKGEDPEILTGRLAKPEGKGPFPALILLHGCIGIDKQSGLRGLHARVMSPCKWIALGRL
jgi:hypothetical protein